MNFLSMLDLNTFSVIILAINLLLGILLMASIKFIASLLCSADAFIELTEKDNPAFGISIAGLTLAIITMMTGVSSGEASESYWQEALAVLGFGILGILLMLISHFIFDKLSMTRLDIKREIYNKNASAGVLDAGNVLASAIIIKALMVWVDSYHVKGIFILIGGFICSQLLLSLASVYRITLYNKFHKRSLQNAIKENNMALAFRFSGYRLGIAFAITATSGLIPYTHEHILPLFVLWLGLSLGIMVIVSALTVLADKVILWGIQTRDEVDNQANLAIGIVQCIITISIGMLVSNLTL